MPQKKKLKTISPEDAAISNYLMQKNKDKNFVQRAYDPNRQSIQVPGESGRSTHLMAYDPGSQRVYPEIVQQNGQLQYMPGDTAWNYADSTGEYISMPPSEKTMKMLSDYGYKHASGMPIYKKGGPTMKVKITGIPKKSAIPENRVNPFSVPDEFKYGGNLPGQKFGNRRIDTYSDFLRQPMKGITYQQSPYSATGKQLPEVPDNTDGAIVVEKQEQVMGDFNGDGMPVLMGTNVGSHDSGDDLTTMVPDGSFVFSDTKDLTIKDPQILEMFGKKKPMTPAQIAKQYDLQNYKKILDDKERGEVDKNTARLMYSNYTDKLNLLASVQEEMKMEQDEVKQNRQYKKGGKIPMYDDGGNVQWELDEYNIPRPVTMVTAKRPDNIMQQPYPQFMPAQPDAFVPQVAAVPGALPFKVGADEDKEKGKSKGKKEKQYNSSHPFNPDTLAAVTAGMRALQYPDYNPIKQVAHGAIPQAVYMDPTRAKAAIQEGVNSATNAIAMGATGPVSRANILALQGKAGTDAANVEAQYAQQNAQIANRTNEQAAQLYNQLWKDQQNYNKEYVEETHNAQMDKLGYQATTQNELLKQAYMAENRKRTAQNYNYVNPYYTMDSRGYIYPKSKEQLRAVRAIGNGPVSGGGSGKEVDTYMALYKQAIAKGMDPKRADMWAAGQSGMLQKQSTTYDSKDPMSQKVRTSNDYDEQRRGGPIKKSKVKIVGLPS